MFDKQLQHIGMVIIYTVVGISFAVNKIVIIFQIRLILDNQFSCTIQTFLHKQRQDGIKTVFSNRILFVKDLFNSSI